MNVRVNPQGLGGAAPPSSSPSRVEKILKAVALIHYAIYMIWTGLALLGNLFAILSGNGSMSVAVGFAVNLWGLVAGLALAAAVLNLKKWTNGKRLAVGLTATGVLVGSFSVSVLTSALSIMAPAMGAVSVLSPAFLVTTTLSLLVGPFLMFGLGAMFVVGALATLFGLVGFFFVLPMMVFQQVLQFENLLHMYRYQSGGLMGYVARFIYWLRNQPMPKALPDDSKGARFAEPEEIAALNCPTGMGFGHVNGEVLRIDTDKHVLVMASTRSGKGTALIIAHLLRHLGSAFILDPKGENAKATGRRRGEINDKVLYLDPFGISGKPKARFNPLSRFTPATMEAESKALAAALFVPGEGEKRDHWFERGLQLVALFIMFVFASDKIPANRKDLLTVRRLLLGKPRTSLEAMKQVTSDDGTISNLAQSFLDVPEKEFGSIVSTAQSQTNILDNPAMKECLAAAGPGEEVDFKDWRRGTMTVYLCLAAPKFPVFNRWLRLVLTSALDEMTDTLDPPAVPVCFMLDELATLGHLQPIENAIGLAAGYGVQLVTVWQDIGQMRDLYKSRWSSFIGNAGVRVLFNLNDYHTAKYWSDFIGGRVSATYSRQEDMHGLSSGQNVGEAMRPLLSPEAIELNFSADKMLVLAQGARPVITDRTPYWQDETLKDLWDDPRTPTQRLRSPMPPRPPQSPPPSSGPTPPRPSGGPKDGPKPSPQPSPQPSSSAFSGFASTLKGGWPGSYKPQAGASAKQRVELVFPANGNQGAPQAERTLARTEKAHGFTFHIYSDETVKITGADGAVRWSTLAELNKGRT